MRANLIFTFDFGSQEIRNAATISTPVDIKFETFIFEQAINLVSTILKNKFKTTLEEDLIILDQLDNKQI